MVVNISAVVRSCKGVTRCSFWGPPGSAVVWPVLASFLLLISCATALGICSEEQREWMDTLAKRSLNSVKCRVSLLHFFKSHMLSKQYSLPRTRFWCREARGHLSSTWFRLVLISFAYYYNSWGFLQWTQLCGHLASGTWSLHNKVIGTSTLVLMWLIIVIRFSHCVHIYLSCFGIASILPCVSWN